MAKSFKQPSSPLGISVTKPSSERDFFDLMEEDTSAASSLTDLPASPKPTEINLPTGAPFSPLPSKVVPTTRQPSALAISSGASELLPPSNGVDTTGNVGHSGNTDSQLNRRNKQHTHPTGNTSMTGIPATTPITRVPEGGGATGSNGNTDTPVSLSSPVLPPTTAGPQTHEGGSVRQTFVLSRAHLERLRDYVHDHRASGEYLYSQKQALEEALDLLFARSSPVAPRPQQVRDLEYQRRISRQQSRPQ